MRIRLDIGVQGKVWGFIPYRADMIPREKKEMEEGSADQIINLLAHQGIIHGLPVPNGSVFIEKRKV